MKEFSPESLFDLSDFPHNDLFKDITYSWEALEKIESYLKKILTKTTLTPFPKNIYIDNPSLVFLEKGCIIEPGAYIKGPCYIGEGSVIRHGAYVRENVIIGKKCLIGHDTEVKRSILLNRVKAAHFNYIGDSILGNHVNLGAGAKCANVRLDEKPIVVLFNSQKTPTNLKKLGAILGDGSQVGCNSVLNPGTIFGKQSICYPCLHVQGFVPEGQIIKHSQKGIHANVFI